MNIRRCRRRVTRSRFHIVIGKRTQPKLPVAMYAVFEVSFHLPALASRLPFVEWLLYHFITWAFLWRFLISSQWHSVLSPYSWKWDIFYIFFFWIWDLFQGPRGTRRHHFDYFLEELLDSQSRSVRCGALLNQQYGYTENHICQTLSIWASTSKT